MVGGRRASSWGGIFLIWLAELGDASRYADKLRLIARPDTVPTTPITEAQLPIQRRDEETVQRL